MESINLNLIPQGANPVVHAKQFDEGRGFRFNLFNGTAPIVLTGAETITCNVKKPDGNLVTVAVTNTSSNYVEVYTTLQMCACYGANLGEIRLEEDGNDIGTLNFTLSVEESPLNNGIESESSIHNLNTMVDEMVAEEVATQYDSANVIFDNEPTENHGVGYTVTSEGIKTAIDNAFDYDNTASGSLVHITDGADNIPVKSLVSQIVAVESGSGEKSPDNPYTISGFDSGIITRCGKNLFDYTQLTSASGWTESGGVYSGSIGNLYAFASKGFPIQPKWKTNQQYVFKLKVNNAEGNSRFRFIYTDNTYTDLVIAPANVGNYVSIVTTINKTVSNLIYFYNLGGNLSISEMCLNLGDTATTYEAYNGNTYTFAFGQTVYGGQFDNKGNLVVTHGMVDLGSLTWGFNADVGHQYFSTIDITNIKTPSSLGEAVNGICSNYPLAPYSYVYGNAQDKIIGVSTSGRTAIYDTDTLSMTGEQFKTAMSGVIFVYELANPITLAITSRDIPTLLGENNIFSNCGDVEVTYYTSKSNDILEFIDSEIGKKNGTNIPIEENSPDSIKDYIDNVSLSGLSDTDISGETSGQILAFDGANWVNTNQIVVKYEEKDIAFDSSGEGTLYYANGYILGLKDIPSDSLYIGYITYMAGTKTMVKGFNRSATSFDSTAIANTTRKIGIYYLDNIATQ